MRYKVTGGIEQGIHYTKFVEDIEDEQQDPSMNLKENAAKSVDSNRHLSGEDKNDDR